MQGTQLSPQALQLRQEIQKAHEKAKASLHTLFITNKIVVADQKLKMVYYLMERLNEKQAKNFDVNVQKQPFNPFLHPEQNLLIKEMGDRHRLLFNKFNIYDYHLLVITRQFQSQNEPISQGDILNAALVCQALSGVIFFNGGEHSGASQKHKHLQILPNEANQLPILQQIYQFVNSQHQFNLILQFPSFKFIHGIIVLNPIEKSSLGQQLYNAYNLLYKTIIVDSKGSKKSYNLICCQKFMLVVIRRKQSAFDQLSVNSLGYMGSLLFKNKQLMNKYISDFSPSLILADISQTQL